jgi:uncharacterized protein
VTVAASHPLDLVAACRRAGMAVPVSSAIALAEALVVLDPDGLDTLYHAGRATLVSRHDDLPRYDDAFVAFLTGAAVEMHSPSTDETPPAVSVVAVDDGADQGGDDDPIDGRVMTYSRVEVLRHADLGDVDDADRAIIERLIGELRVARSTRRSRRRRATRRSRGPVDLRRTARRARRTAGEVIAPVRTERAPVARRLVLLLDVSGSMESYARALVRFAHAAATGRRVEVFALGTRLTRVTRELEGRDPDRALAAAGAVLPDWGGGTRLGETLREFNDRWGVPGMARDATIVILSDGWDRGDPELLAEQMARLDRVAHRVVWVNPLKAAEGYAPLAAGMAAALPHVDDFVAGHSLEALGELAEVLGR